ncbi:hypothetical protein NW752_012250 [Fusarium irregulare]|nr:hypothetical protein NW752_012250 [Fusarium irregulare]
MKASTALIIVLDPLIPLNHETTVDMTKAVVNAIMAPKFSLGLAHNQLVTEEKQKLGEWLHRSTKATNPNVRATIEDFRNCLNKIFQG